jgi:hypothetical protein
MSGSGHIRASVDAAGGRWETTVRAVRDAFGMSRLTAKGRARIVAALEEEGLRIDPGLVGMRLDDRVAVVDARPAPAEHVAVAEPPGPDPVAEARRGRMVLAGLGLVGVAAVVVAILAGTGGGGPGPDLAPVGPAVVAASAASASTPLVAARIDADGVARRRALRIARLQREYAAAVRLARAGRYTAARERMHAVGRFRDGRAKTRLYARAARAHR